MDIIKSPQDQRKAFLHTGSLLQLLVAGDLAYAGIIDMPTVEEMGILIAKVSKGAIAGLVVLQLLPTKEKGYKYPPVQVLKAFTSLYKSLQEKLTEDEWQEMGLNTVVLEHCLCKLKRVRNLL